MLDTFRVAAEAGPNFVPLGVAWPQAEPGVAALARAIAEWWRTRPGGGLDVPARVRSSVRRLDVVLPAGTGTTALFLARHVRKAVSTQHPALAATMRDVVRYLEGLGVPWVISWRGSSWPLLWPPAEIVGRKCNSPGGGPV